MTAGIENWRQKFITTPRTNLEFAVFFGTTILFLCAGVLGLGVGMEKEIIKNLSDGLLYSAVAALVCVESGVQAVRLARRISNPR